MALTTEDELRKQLTVIFGFKGRLHLEVGNIVGIGTLSQKNTEILIKDVLNFLDSYSSFLKDYTGCTLHSIEFELKNLKKTSNFSLIPKSMLFIPGEYKNCSTILLLLSPEMNLLNHSKAKKAVDDLGKIFFEVEEALERPELKNNQRQIILTKFAHRFALKLQGECIEKKWDRKLIGIKSKEVSDPYLSINMSKKIKWNVKEIFPKNPRFSEIKLKLNEKDYFEFIKYNINNSSAYLVAKNTFKLSSNLLKIANTGTISDLEKQIFTVFLNNFIDFTGNRHEIININMFKTKIDDFLINIADYLEEYKKISDEFVKSGEINTFANILNKYKENFSENSVGIESSKNNCLFDLFKITKFHLNSNRYDLERKKKIRAIEFKIPILYVEQSAEMIIKKLKKIFPFYFQSYLLQNYFQTLLDLLKREFDSINQKTIRSLSYVYLNKFEAYFHNKIEKSSLTVRTTTQHGVFEYFQEIFRDLIEPFIDQVSYKINDLLNYCLIILGDIKKIKPHIELLKKFSHQINFLHGLILRNSALQRYLIEYPDDLTFDPNQFSLNFLEFLRKKRFAGLQMKWKHVVFKYISDFGKIYQPKYLKDLEMEICWSKEKIVKNFTEYLRIKIEEETSLEGFLKPLKKYLNKVAMKNVNDRIVNEVFDCYLKGLDIIKQFPDYIHQVFNKIIEKIPEKQNPQSLSSFLGPIYSLDEVLSGKDILKKRITNKRSFYEYTLNQEMKYFSNLLAKPKQIILESIKNNLIFDGKSKKTLIHKIDFKSLGEKFEKMTISSNYKEIKPKF